MAERVLQTREKNIGINHSFWMEKRMNAAITGVLEVKSFDENEIVLKVEGGVMVVNGENLHVSKLVLEEGKVDISGHIDGVQYETPLIRTGLFGFWKQKRK